MAYEWSEFEKLEGCCIGPHTDEKQEATEFWQSSTVANASNAIEKERIAALKTAADFNREQEEKKKAEEAKKAAEATAAKNPVVSIIFFINVFIDD